jgi:nicotinate-nucleotide adenylyltransferase
MLKIAIYGGSFDPIHVGHIQVAQHVLNNSKEFDQVWLMPCFRHMYDKRMSAPEHRFAMCELAAAVDRRISVSNYEIKNQLAGETYHLIKKLVEEPLLKDRYTFAYIIGQDNANSFDKWVNYEFLERAMQFVVIPRKGIPFDQNSTWYLKPPHIFMAGDTNIMEVSSTQVRETLKRNDSAINKLVNPAVLAYIKEHNLY